MKNFDLIILGGGAGAFGAAIRANDLNAKTALINSGLPLGGTCVNVGCVPSKTLIHAGAVLHQAQHHGIPGIEMELKHFDFQKVVQDERALVERLQKEKYQTVLQDLKNVTFINGKGRFLSEHEVDVNGETLKAEKFIIATGSTATVPPIEGIRETGYVTHIEALKLTKQPKELIIVGAGPVGLEFAQMFARFGTKVTMLQHSGSIFRPGEKIVVERLQEVLQKEGIDIVLNAEVKGARKEKEKKILTYMVDGKEHDVAGDEILLAIGKTPNTADLDLGKAGVEIDKKQAIVTKPVLQTSQPHIFAAGDVTNLPLRLEPTAGNEGTLAAENALTGSQKNIDYRTVPYTIFTDPELAGVGYTEEEYLKKTGRCDCRVLNFTDVPKAIILRRTEGIIKMIIDPETKRIVGVHILAPHSGELIAEAMVLIRNENTIYDVTASLPMFPTLAEAIKIVAMSFTRDVSKLSCCV
ncbi:mercury(II) reductase [Candidatus Peregrinibacteria bacterium CG10_big_fil_rev_8_21_14_0_10_49_10]|nr:MAG: mercury(II) reductase [Candidatus Peregrinibacteria bacterium CG10_big_fil_rev_8_21_14_0_10_49_10]